MPDTAPHILWRGFGRPAPAGKTGLLYRFEPTAGRCATCAAPIVEGVPFAPRRGVAGIDNDTFYGHAEYARFGTHVCRACAWLYGDPKRTHRGVIAAGDRGWWPTISKPMDGRPRWREVFGYVARLAPETPLTGVLTVDPKPRLWPRAEAATVGAPGLYVHSPDHDRSRWTLFSWREVAEALVVVDAVRALGATKSAIWSGVYAPKFVDQVGVDAIEVVETRLEPLRGSDALLIAVLIA